MQLNISSMWEKVKDKYPVISSVTNGVSEQVKNAIPFLKSDDEKHEDIATAISSIQNNSVDPLQSVLGDLNKEMEKERDNFSNLSEQTVLEANEELTNNINLYNHILEDSSLTSVQKLQKIIDSDLKENFEILKDTYNNFLKRNPENSSDYEPKLKEISKKEEEFKQIERVLELKTRQDELIEKEKKNDKLLMEAKKNINLLQQRKIDNLLDSSTYDALYNSIEAIFPEDKTILQFFIDAKDHMDDKAVKGFIVKVQKYINENPTKSYKDLLLFVKAQFKEE